MDSLHAIGFYASSGVSLAGGLGVALLPRRDWRGVALGVTALGIAGLYLSLSAGFAAALALLCLIGCGLLIAGPRYRVLEPVVHPLGRQLGAVAAAALLAVIAYSAFKGDFVQATFYGGALNVAGLGRLLFAHDALAVDAIGVLALAAVAGATIAWRVRERAR